MVYKELIVGFLVAGAVAALVPASFFQTLFPRVMPGTCCRYMSCWLQCSPCSP